MHAGTSQLASFCSAAVSLLQAVFRVGVEAGRDAGVLRNPVVARLRRVLCGWLSLRQDVRTLHPLSPPFSQQWSMLLAAHALGAPSSLHPASCQRPARG